MTFPIPVSKDLILVNGAIPLSWWTVKSNFGDLLSPYLVSKMTAKPVTYVHLNSGNNKYNLIEFAKPPASYLCIGSIISRANSSSIVWGSGSFGTENKNNLNKEATYLAVRGPLTRNLLRIHGIECPAVYGDPALLLPQVYNPPIKKQYKIGIILRWSEFQWHNVGIDSSIKIINFGTR